MKAYKKEKIVKVEESDIPRIYLYFNDVPIGRKSIPGVDYIGYLIHDSWTDNPFYFVPKKGIVYLSPEQKAEMHKLFGKKIEKRICNVYPQLKNNSKMPAAYAV